MLENITVDEAISKGHKTITYPGMLLLFGLMVLTVFLGILLRPHVWIWLVGLPLSFILPCIFWGIRITKWKVWAFSKVRNVHELRKRAVLEMLMYNDHSFYNKMEIWNASDKEQWLNLQCKFELKDEVIPIHDPNVPSETIIYYSKRKNYYEMVIMLGCLAFGIYLITQSDRFASGIFLILIGGYFAYREYKKAATTTPQVIINERGIQTISTGFFEWSQIEEEDVEAQGFSKNASRYLAYKHPEGFVRLLIDDLDIDHKELKRLLNIYRARSENERYK